MSGSSVATILRRQVRERASSCCEYCLLAEEDAFFRHEVDHIIAVKHGGDSTLENMCWACFDWNRFKGSDIASLEQESGDLIPLFHPRQHNWSEHFLLEGGRIFPQSPIGRVTERLLKLNLPQRVEARETLSRTGRYPRKREVAP